MRLQLALFCVVPLCTTAYAQQQQYPLGSWLSKISSYLPFSIQTPENVARHVSNVASSTIAETAAARIVPLTLENWQSTLKPDAATTKDRGQEEWWVLITGGNRTCHGECEAVEKAWNETAVVFNAAPNTPHQAILDCDKTPVLCSAWYAGPPAIWHMLIPRDAGAHTQIRILPLNATTVSTDEIVKIHTSQSWTEYQLYNGPFHPLDGWLAKLKLSVPVGYVLSAFSQVPSWLFMLVISFVSRSFMNRRTNARLPRRGAGPNGGQAAPN